MSPLPVFGWRLDSGSRATDARLALLRREPAAAVLLQSITPPSHLLLADAGMLGSEVQERTEEGPPEPVGSTMVHKQDILPACVRAITHPRCVCVRSVLLQLFNPDG